MRSRSFRRGQGARSALEIGLAASILALALLGGCGSDDAANNGDPANTGGTATGTEGGTDGTGDRTGKGGRSSTGGGSSTGGNSSNAGSGGDDGGGDDILAEGEDGPGYDGIDDDELALTAPPSGCAGGYDPDSQTLELTLDAKVPAVILAAIAGVITANGNACASAADDPAAVDSVITVRVTGGKEANAVYIDGASDFGTTLLAADAGFELDLGAGENQLVLLGSDDKDHIELGSDGDALVADFSGDLEPDVHAVGIAGVKVSTGPKPDSVAADGSALGLDPVAVLVRLFGSGANDTLTGGAADDELFGGIGNDTLIAGLDAGGADHYDGGTGEDLVDYSARAAGVTVALDGDANDGEADENDNVDPNVEDVRGGAGANEITGSAQGNRLWGGPSGDIIRGGDGEDFIYGDAGDDDLRGENGDDYLYGEDGDDTLTGGEGDDLLDGFPGKNDLNGGPGDADICQGLKGDKATACEL